jgi:predicted solute-binding protein
VGPAGVSPAVVQSGSAGRAQLLIGDQAIRFRENHADEFQFWDLGEQWNKLMGLPFVYALLLIRPEVSNPKQIADRLRGLRNENLGRLNELIADAVARLGLSRRSSKAKADDPGHPEITRQFLSAYYHEHLRFSFGKKEKEGLRTFAQLCAKRGLLPKGGIAFDLV